MCVCVGVCLVGVGFLSVGVEECCVGCFCLQMFRSMQMARSMLR